jgi:hypothetical protein
MQDFGSGDTSSNLVGGITSSRPELFSVFKKRDESSRVSVGFELGLDILPESIG